MAIKCETLSNWGVLGIKTRKGYKTELQLRRVRWGNSQPLWDIREWDGRDQPGKGITLTDEMMRNLIDILETVKANDTVR